MLTDGTLGEDAQPSHDAVAFTGTRSELFGRLLRGYLQRASNANASDGSHDHCFAVH